MFRSRWAAIGAAVAVTLGGGGLIGVSAADTSSTLVPIAPVRVLDTRASDMVGDINDGASITVQVTGSIATVSEGTKTVVPSGASAITGNMTLVSTTSNDYGGFATIYPCGTRPDASNINFTSGQTVANSVAVPLSASGTVCIYVFGTAHVLLDVAGYYTRSEISDLAERVTAIEGDTAVSGLDERVTTIENEAVSVPTCEWYEKLESSTGGLFCVLDDDVVVSLDQSGTEIITWQSRWQDDTGTWHYLHGSGESASSGGPRSYGFPIYFPTSDCSGEGYFPLRDDEVDVYPNNGEGAFVGSTYTNRSWPNSLTFRRVAVEPSSGKMYSWRLEENNSILNTDVTSYLALGQECQVGGLGTSQTLYQIVWLAESETNSIDFPLEVAEAGRTYQNP